MGLISRNLSESDKFVRTGNECTECSSTKAVAGMENNTNNLTNRDEKGAGTAVEKTTEDGKKYVLADGPVSNLFTKALQVKYGTGDQKAELSNRRPTTSGFGTDDREVVNTSLTTSNESAAQDVTLQTNSKLIIVDRFNKDLSATSIRISKDTGDARNPVTTNPMHALSEIVQTGIDIDFVLVQSEAPDGTNTTDVVVPGLDQINKLKEEIKENVGNENLELLSVKVVITYK